MNKSPSKSKSTDILNFYFDPIVENDEALTVFTPVEEMPEGEPWDSIKLAYSRQPHIFKVVGTLMNGVASSQKRSFLLSRSFLIRYLSEDPNLAPEDKKTHLSGQAQEKLMDTLLAKMNKSKAVLVQFRPPSERGVVEKRAGLYEFVPGPFTSVLPWWDNGSSGLYPGSVQASSYKSKDKHSVSVCVVEDNHRDNQTPSPEARLNQEDDVNQSEYMKRLQNLGQLLVTPEHRAHFDELLVKYFAVVNSVEKYQALPVDKKQVFCALLLFKDKQVLPPAFMHRLRQGRPAARR